MAEHLWRAVRNRSPLPVPVVDAHAHMGPYSRFFIDDPSPDSVLAVMDACGVDLTVFSSHRGIELDAVEGNLETRAIVERYPDRFAGWLVVNPHQDPDAVLAKFGDDPSFVGLKLHPDLHEYPITGPRYEQAWAWSAERGRPLLVHTWGGSPHDDPRMVGEAAGANPGAVALLGHSGAHPAGLDAAITAALETPGLVLETCGSTITGRWIQRMVRTVGADRVVFGSDVPFLDLRYQLGRVAFLDLTDAERAALLHDNARRILRLPEPADREARPVSTAHGS